MQNTSGQVDRMSSLALQRCYLTNRPVGTGIFTPHLLDRIHRPCGEQHWSANVTGKKQEQIALLELDGAGIQMAKHLTSLPPKELLREKLHRAIALARARLEGQNEELESLNAGARELEGRIAENVAKLLGED